MRTKDDTQHVIVAENTEEVDGLLEAMYLLDLLLTRLEETVRARLAD